MRSRRQYMDNDEHRLNANTMPEDATGALKGELISNIQGDFRSNLGSGSGGSGSGVEGSVKCDMKCANMKGSPSLGKGTLPYLKKYGTSAKDVGGKKSKTIKKPKSEICEYFPNTNHAPVSFQFHSSTFWRQHKLFEQLILSLVPSSPLVLYAADSGGHSDEHSDEINSGRSTQAMYLYDLPEKTHFLFREEDILEQMMERVKENCPELVQNKERFMRAVESIVFPAPVLPLHIFP
jgi:hypothetical protein